MDDVNLVDSCVNDEDDLIDSCVDGYCANNFEPANAYYKNCDQDFGTSEVFHVQGIQEEFVEKRPLVENCQLPLQSMNDEVGNVGQLALLICSIIDLVLMITSNPM